MPASRKNPDVSMELGQKLDVDAVPPTRNVITERRHRIDSRQLRANLPQRIPRPGGDHAEVGLNRPGFRVQTPSAALFVDPQHARLLDLSAGALGPLEQQAIQIVS